MFSSYRNLNLSLFPATCETKPTDPEGDISVQPADLFWQFEIWLMAQFLCSGPERSLQLSSSYMKHLHCSDCWCNSLSRISSLRPSTQTRLFSASERLFPFCLLQIKLFFFFIFFLINIHLSKYLKCLWMIRSSLSVSLLASGEVTTAFYI